MVQNVLDTQAMEQPLPKRRTAPSSKYSSRTQTLRRKHSQSDKTVDYQLVPPSTQKRTRLTNSTAPKNQEPQARRPTNPPVSRNRGSQPSTLPRQRLRSDSVQPRRTTLEPHIRQNQQIEPQVKPEQQTVPAIPVFYPYREKTLKKEHLTPANKAIITEAKIYKWARIIGGIAGFASGTGIGFILGGPIGAVIGASIGTFTGATFVDSIAHIAVKVYRLLKRGILNGKGIGVYKTLLEKESEYIKKLKAKKNKTLKDYIEIASYYAKRWGIALGVILACAGVTIGGIAIIGGAGALSGGGWPIILASNIIGAFSGGEIGGYIGVLVSKLIGKFQYKKALKLEEQQKEKTQQKRETQEKRQAQQKREAQEKRQVQEKREVQEKRQTQNQEKNPDQTRQKQRVNTMQRSNSSPELNRTQRTNLHPELPNRTNERNQRYRTRQKQVRQSQLKQARRDNMRSRPDQIMKITAQ